LSHLITHKLSRTPLDERSARRRDLYVRTHIAQKRHVHAPNGNGTRNPSKQATVDVSLKLHGRRGWFYLGNGGFEPRFPDR